MGPTSGTGHTDDHDDLFPSFLDVVNLGEVLSPYESVNALVEATVYYDWHQTLSSRSVMQVAKPATTWVLKSKNPDALNLFDIGFADGHVNRVTRRELSLVEQGIVLPSHAASNLPPPANTVIGSQQRRKSNPATLSSALQNFRLDNDQYPTAKGGLSALTTKPMSASKWRGPYLTKPVGNDPCGHPYIDQSPGSGGKDSYFLESYGADGKPGGQGEDADMIESSN